MKTNLLLSILMVLALSSCSNLNKTSEKQVKVVVNYQFVNISKGFNHDTKIIIRINGNQIAESVQHKESQKQTLKFLVPKGQNKLEIMNYALFEDNWEKHTKENNYSQDCFYIAEMDFKKKTIIKLTFDLNEGTFVEVR